jgi:hypothetical protein
MAQGLQNPCTKLFYLLSQVPCTIMNNAIPEPIVDAFQSSDFEGDTPRHIIIPTDVNSEFGDYWKNELTYFSRVEMIRVFGFLYNIFTDGSNNPINNEIIFP